MRGFFSPPEMYFYGVLNMFCPLLISSDQFELFSVTFNNYQQTHSHKREQNFPVEEVTNRSPLP